MRTPRLHPIPIIFGLLAALATIFPAMPAAATTVNAALSMPPNNLGLVGWWTFDGGNMVSNVADSSGQGNNGDLLGGATTTVPGPMGQALSFNGTSQYVASPSLGVPPSSITLSAWIKPNAAGGVVLTEQGQTGQNAGWHDSQMEVETNNSIKVCVWTGGLTCVIAATSITYGNWYHVVMTYDSSSHVLSSYVNGIPGATVGATKQYPGTLYYLIASADSTNGGNGSYFSGSIDDVRIYNRALSAAEVTQMYTTGLGSHIGVTGVAKAIVNASFTPSNLRNGLVGWWTFDGGNMVSNVADSSGQGNNGDLLGGATTTVPGPMGQALSFNGTNQYVNLGSSSTLKPTAAITVSAWVRLNSFTTNGRYLADWHQSTSLDRWLFYQANSTQIYWLVSSANELSTANVAYSPTLNTWIHLVGVYNGSNVFLYANGSLVGSAPLTGAMNAGVGEDVTLGTETEVGTYLNGSIDDVRIYNRALSGSEILQLYNLGH